MQAQGRSRHSRLRSGWGGSFLLLTGIVFLLAACSDDSLLDLGDRSSGWIGEVATTASTTTTTAPVLVQSAMDVDWFNDEFGAPDPDREPGQVLAAVFARSGDSSQYLQASRAEIAAVVPEAEFLGIVPIQVSHVTSQLVIESRELVLADDPTVAFGLWSVEPYSRSRSVGQAGILNVSRDPDGVALAATGDDEAVCNALVTGQRVCAVESLTNRQTWRLEDAGGIVHIWFEEPFRYSLSGFHGYDEELIHRLIESAVRLRELLPVE